MSPQLKIVSPVVTLRTFTSDDADKVFRMSQEADLRTWIPSQVYRDLAHAEKALAYLISQYREGADPRTCPIVFGVERTATGDLIGHVGLSPFPDSVEIGFAIEDSQKRNGYASAAIEQMCDWAAKEFALEKIHGFVAKENDASKRVLLRTGFKVVREETMLFQGSLERVVIFEWNRK